MVLVVNPLVMESLQCRIQQRLHFDQLPAQISCILSSRCGAGYRPGDDYSGSDDGYSDHRSVFAYHVQPPRHFIFHYDTSFFACLNARSVLFWPPGRQRLRATKSQLPTPAHLPAPLEANGRGRSGVAPGRAARMARLAFSRRRNAAARSLASPGSPAPPSRASPPAARSPRPRLHPSAIFARSGSVWPAHDSGRGQTRSPGRTARARLMRVEPLPLTPSPFGAGAGRAPS